MSRTVSHASTPGRLAAAAVRCSARAGACPGRYAAAGRRSVRAAVSGGVPGRLAAGVRRRQASGVRRAPGRCLVRVAR